MAFRIFFPGIIAGLRLLDCVDIIGLRCCISSLKANELFKCQIAYAVCFWLFLWCNRLGINLHKVNTRIGVLCRTYLNSTWFLSTVSLLVLAGKPMLYKAAHMRKTKLKVSLLMR